VVDISPILAWMSGNATTGAHVGQLLEKWNGTKWSVFPGAPKFAPNQQADVFAMTSTSANDIWAVGNLVDESSGLEFSLFEHFDGTTWTFTTVESTAFQDLAGASADSPNDAWAVGFFETGGIVNLSMHWNGATWSSVPVPNVGTGTNQLNAVLALAPDNAWAVGLSTPTLHANTLNLIEHFDGTRWTVVPSPNTGTASNRLFGITGTSADDLWAFGSFFAEDGSGHQMTLLLHWDGTSWATASSPNPTKDGFLSDVLFAGVNPSPGNVWIFGSEDEAPHDATLAIHTTGSD
jgi:hypothetical protein